MTTPRGSPFGNNQQICPITGFVSVSSIRLTRTLLPSHAILGEDLVLECGYDMEGDRLYSVKWCVVTL